MDFRQFLKTLPAFERFTPAYIDVLSNTMSVEECPDGFRFIVQGHQGEAMFLLMQGNVRVSRASEITGEEEETLELRAGELFGLLSLIDDMPAGASCTAEGPVTVAALPRESFHELFDSAPPIGHHLQYMVAVQLARDLQGRNKALQALLGRPAA